MMVAPLLLTVALSFATQNGFQSDPHADPGRITRCCLRRRATSTRVLIVKSLWMSFTATIAVVLLAYPMAYYLAFRVHRAQAALDHPDHRAVLDQLSPAGLRLEGDPRLQRRDQFRPHLAGVIDQPLEFLLYNPTAVTITLGPCLGRLCDPADLCPPSRRSTARCSRRRPDLGDGPLRRFLRITLPLSLPGTIAATLLVFIPTVGDYLTPSLVGGTSGIMVGNSIATLYGKANNGPMGAALSIAMMLAITLVVCAFLALIGPKRLRRKAA